MEKYVLSQMKDENFSKASAAIYSLTDYNKLQYPDYYIWFYRTNIPRILAGSGEAIFYLDGFQIVGLSILKKDLESKICTFMVNEDYRKRGFSSLLLEESFDFLGTSKPLITIPQTRIDEFSSIIDSYGWEATRKTDEYYSPEIIFNDRKKSFPKTHKK